MNEVHILLLAAGASSRMKSAKQLLAWGDDLLIVHQIKSLLATHHKVTVVLGAYADLIRPVIADLPVQILINEQWKEGMGSSIAFGVKTIQNTFPKTKGILVTLVDQPLLTFAHFISILNAFESGRHQIIVAKSSSGHSGPPVLFDAHYFEPLKQLKGDEGAKPLLQSNSDKVSFVTMEGVTDDIDTPEAYQRLKHYKFNHDKD